MNLKTVLFLGCTVSVVLCTPVSRQCSRNLRNSDKSDFISDGADFSLNLYKKARELAGDDRANIFFSPASVSLALGMVNVGARGTTRYEILDALMPSIRNQRMHDVHAWMNSELNSEGKDYQLHTGNAVFVEETLNVREAFLQKLEGCFKYELETMDFKNQPESARQEINEWVEDQTNDRIRDLIPEGAIDSLTRLVLANAIYFKGEWQYPFITKNGALTRNASFYPVLPRSEENSQQIQLMGMKSMFLYHQTNDVKVLGIPYKSNELTMFFFLPSGSLEEFQEKMESGLGLTELMAQTTNRTVDVSIPKFKLNAELKLKDALKGLGMRKMFQKRVADLSGITGDRSLFVSDAFHKAFIEVNIRKDHYYLF